MRNEDSEMVCRFRGATGGHEDQEEQLLGKSRRKFRKPASRYIHFSVAVGRSEETKFKNATSSSVLGDTLTWSGTTTRCGSSTYM